MAPRSKTRAKAKQAASERALELPPGVTLSRAIHADEGYVFRVAFHPAGDMLASVGYEGLVKLWELASGDLLRSLPENQHAGSGLAFDASSGKLASVGRDRSLKLWNPTSGEMLMSLEGRSGRVPALAFDPQGAILASTESTDRSVKLWDPASGTLLNSLGAKGSRPFSLALEPMGSLVAAGDEGGSVRLWDRAVGNLVRTIKAHQGETWGLAFHPDDSTLASGGFDNTIKLWNPRSGKLLRTLEGHITGVYALAYSPDGALLASLDNGGSVRVWSCETWDTLAVIPGAQSPHFTPALAFHPSRPILAAVGQATLGSTEPQQVILLWELDLDTLLGGTPGLARRKRSVHYVNAKVVLVGDTGVGKTGLSLVLNGKPFEATDSTPGRRVWTLSSEEIEVSATQKQTRETLLWDLAGQPGYRVIHQLHLNEIAVALVVFDARSETDPLAGVRHWERALRLAHQRQGDNAVPLKKFLVLARADRGGVSLSKERLDALVSEHGFDGYFETSAKEGWKIPELKAAIEGGIEWPELPVVTSNELFTSIKAFLLDVKKTGRLLTPADLLFDEFVQKNPELEDSEKDLRAQFDACVGRLENRDLIRRLSFGGFVLLQPELLDAYASAMVIAAKDEPDGLGSIAEEAALSGQFFVPDEQKVKDVDQEEVLVHATVEELVRHDLALKESAEDGRYLVFPSQFNRDYEDAPEPKGKTVAITFDGPVQSIYSTLAVRLGHSGLFDTTRIEMWRNAAIFTASAGGKCGIYLHEFAEARGRMLLFFEPEASEQTRLHFEDYVSAHLGRRALADTVEAVRFFVCQSCDNPVPDAYVKMLREQNLKLFSCPCGSKVSLAEPKEKLSEQYPSQVEAMNRSADERRDFEAFLTSAAGETRTQAFDEWAGGERVTLAIVFTDVVGSTEFGYRVRDARMNTVRSAHFEQSRGLIVEHKGREIKTIGDSFMAAFRSVESALDYARELQNDPGHREIKVRAGIHIGPMSVEENDVFGSAVNYAARVVGAIDEAEIWLSERAKEDLESRGAKHHKNLKWERREDVKMKGFPGTFTLWALLAPGAQR